MSFHYKALPWYYAVQRFYFRSPFHLAHNGCLKSIENHVSIIMVSIFMREWYWKHALPLNQMIMSGGLASMDGWGMTSLPLSLLMNSQKTMFFHSEVARNKKPYSSDIRSNCIQYMCHCHCQDGPCLMGNEWCLLCVQLVKNSNKQIWPGLAQSLFWINLKIKISKLEQHFLGQWGKAWSGHCAWLDSLLTLITGYEFYGT